jgi:hypothetical protein
VEAATFVQTIMSARATTREEALVVHPDGLQRQMTIDVLLLSAAPSPPNPQPPWVKLPDRIFASDFPLNQMSPKFVTVPICVLGATISVYSKSACGRSYVR